MSCRTLARLWRFWATIRSSSPASGGSSAARPPARVWPAHRDRGSGRPVPWSPSGRPAAPAGSFRPLSIFWTPRSSISLAVTSRPRDSLGSGMENSSSRNLETACARCRSRTARCQSTVTLMLNPTIRRRTAAASATPSLVAAHELAGPISQGVLAGDDRQSLEVALEVVGQLVHRGVAALRLLLHRHQDDVVEVAGQPAAQEALLAVADAADRLRGQLDDGAVRPLDLLHPADDAARPERVGLADRPGEAPADRRGAAR